MEGEEKDSAGILSPSAFPIFLQSPISLLCPPHIAAICTALRELQPPTVEDFAVLASASARCSPAEASSPALTVYSTIASMCERDGTQAGRQAAVQAGMLSVLLTSLQPERPGISTTQAAWCNAVHSLMIDAGEATADAFLSRGGLLIM